MPEQNKFGGKKMNVYDTVNKLAQEIKDSEEYKNFKKYKNLVKADTELENKMKQFEELRYETQIAAMQGKKPEEDKEKELQTVYTELLSKENVKEYFDAEFKFNVLIADVNKIIGEAIQDVIQ